VNWPFNDKVALVTGAASGIGLATARAFAEAGAAVTLADVQENAVRSAAEELVSAGHKTIAVRCNVADEADVAAMVEQTVSTFGRLDAAFNNAGVQSPAVETADASGEEFDRVNAINLRGVWNCMKYELRQMREQVEAAPLPTGPARTRRAGCPGPSRRERRECRAPSGPCERIRA
jgi:NAD(P)-dependent dehydrogenase (short-subunit alcohol dehydrogenase family)